MSKLGNCPASRGSEGRTRRELRTHEELTPEKRPQDPNADGSGLRFETLDHGGEYRRKERLHSITSSAMASTPGGNGQPERRCSLEVDDQLNFAWPHNRQIAGLLTFENPADIYMPA